MALFSKKNRLIKDHVFVAHYEDYNTLFRSEETFCPPEIKREMLNALKTTGAVIPDAAEIVLPASYYTAILSGRLDHPTKYPNEYWATVTKYICFGDKPFDIQVFVSEYQPAL